MILSKKENFSFHTFFRFVFFLFLINTRASSKIPWTAEAEFSHWRISQKQICGKSQWSDETTEDSCVPIFKAWNWALWSPQQNGHNFPSFPKSFGFNYSTIQSRRGLDRFLLNNNLILSYLRCLKEPSFDNLLTFFSCDTYNLFTWRAGTSPISTFNSNTLMLSSQTTGATDN